MVQPCLHKYQRDFKENFNQANAVSVPANPRQAQGMTVIITLQMSFTNYQTIAFIINGRD
jgi:hypothetical protein